MNSAANFVDYSSTVEKIYDAALDKDVWPAALQSVVDYVGASSSTITFGNAMATGLEPLLLHSVGLSREFLQGFEKYGPIWAIQSGIPYWKVGEVHHLQDFAPREEFVKSKFYREHLHPHNQEDFMGMVAIRDGSRFAPMTISTDTNVGYFTKDNVESMRQLAPHLCKAVKISFALELKQLNSNMLEQTLNSLNAGIFLIRSDGRVTFMNQAAESLVTRKNGITIANERLTPTDPQVAAHFAQVLGHKSDDKFQKSISMALPDELGGLLATILPLDKGMRQNLAMGTNPAQFAVFVQNPEMPPPLPGESFATLYGLSPAEMRITLAMAPGLAPQDAADILGLSLPTVRTHLQNIFSKTGAKRQADLMQLLMRASSPLAAE